MQRSRDAQCDETEWFHGDRMIVDRARRNAARTWGRVLRKANVQSGWGAWERLSLF